MLDWSFTESNVRPYLGMLSGSFGSASVYGLVGGVAHSTKVQPRDASGYRGGFVFCWDSMLAPSILAPIARYDTRFATALGKYLTFAAKNVSVCFPSHLAQLAGAGQEPTTAAFNKDNPALGAISTYEGVYGSAYGYAPYASGTEDLLKHSESLMTPFGGASAGLLGRLMLPTNVENIYQVDLLVTDFGRPDAYPTYLFYNPYGGIRTVTINVSAARSVDSRLSGPVFLYDMLSDAIIGGDIQPGTASASIDMPLHQAAALVVVPASANLVVKAGDLVDAKTGVTIDYAYGKSAAPARQASLSANNAPEQSSSGTRTQTTPATRDARRMSDLQTLAQGLENFHAARGHYPVTADYVASCWKGAGANWIADNGNYNWSAGILASQPHDPVDTCLWPHDKAFDSSTAAYAYYSDGTKYVLVARLEESGNPNTSHNAQTKWFDGRSLETAHGWFGRAYVKLKAAR